jgi:heme o synthase
LETLTSHVPLTKTRYSKLSGFIKLTKFRLGWLVVFSAVISYLTVEEAVDGWKLFAVIIGGFLVTSSANGFNQVIERTFDALMERTRDRPLPTEVLNVRESVIFCTTAGLIGTAILWYFANPLSAFLGALSIVLYAWVYTPLKRITPFSVFAGAFPGALPVLIGTVAASEGDGSVSFFGLLLFIIQFVWQFPHFWALAWFNHEDYSRAGFFMLPSRGGKDEFTRFQVLIYCAFLLCASVLPFAFGFTGIISTAAVVVCGLALLIQSYNFYRMATDEGARRLFFVTLVYLPLVQVALMTKA